MVGTGCERSVCAKLRTLVHSQFHSSRNQPIMLVTTHVAHGLLLIVSTKSKRACL